MPATRPTFVRRRRALAAVVTIVLLVGAGALAVRLLVDHGVPPIFATCRVVDGTDSFLVDPEQARNATTIAAVGKADGVPDHGVTIALAVAIQESKLHNIDYGDRDSLGLFQQRASQGWGTKAQIMDPVHASRAFYAHLVRIGGWQQLPVTVAAQRVQHSATPTAYAQHETLARALAKAFTGESPAAFTCQFPRSDVATHRPGLDAAVGRELGSAAALGRPVQSPAGWLTASWLVAHASTYGIEQVSYNGRTWVSTKQSWRPDARAGDTVSMRLSATKTH